MNFDIVILTDHRYVAPKQTDDYILNILNEEKLLLDAFEKRGLKAIRKDWADPDFDWAKTRAIIFRSTWDYFHRFDEFSPWLDAVSTQTLLLNSSSLIRWNMDKHYLADLNDLGVNIPPTLFVEPGDEVTLKEILEETEWSQAVIKPAVSGAARHTYLLDEQNFQDLEQLFAELISQEAMLIQPFQHDVTKNGELSLMLFNGIYSHAVLKVAKPGDFRVQDDFGGTVHPHQATREEIDFAKKAVFACPELPVYARVDLIRDNDRQLAVAELELIEPELWFRNCPEAADLLADAVLEKLKEY